jgi:hypothetical protein
MEFRIGTMQFGTGRGQVDTCGTAVDLVDWVVTPKVFANFSPGLGFDNPGNKNALRVIATLKGLRRRSSPNRCRNPFRVAKNLLVTILTQGFRANPGLKLANTFGVNKLGWN